LREELLVSGSAAFGSAVVRFRRGDQRHVYGAQLDARFAAQAGQPKAVVLGRGTLVSSRRRRAARLRIA
jgi:hypothetical protein